MNKMKQREAMKALSIAKLRIKQMANVVNGIIGNIPPEFIESCTSMNEFALSAITSTPAKVFRANKPKVDDRRLRRFHRQLKNVKSLILKIRPSDSEQFKKDWEECSRGPREDITILGIDPIDRTAITRCVTTPGHVNPDFFDEQYMTHPDIENSEESYLIDLHKKAGFDLPYGGDNCSLQSLRASYNFKAKKAGIETYKWTNK